MQIYFNFDLNTSTTRNPYPCLNFLIQLWGIKVEVASFLSSLMSGKVDNLQIFCSQHNNIFVFILIFLVFLSQVFSAFRKGKLVFVRYQCQLKQFREKMIIRITQIAKEWASVLAQFLPKKIYCVLQSRAHCPANTNLNLQNLLTVSHCWPSNHQLSYFI